MSKKYQIKSSSEDPLDSVIEVSGLTSEHTLRDINSGIARYEKLEKELQAKLDYERARMENVEHYHPFVKELSEEDLSTAHLYAEAKQYVVQIEPKLGEVRAAIQADKQTQKKFEKLLGLTPAHVPQEQATEEAA